MGAAVEARVEVEGEEGRIWTETPSIRTDRVAQAPCCTRALLLWKRTASCIYKNFLGTPDFEENLHDLVS